LALPGSLNRRRRARHPGRIAARRQLDAPDPAPPGVFSAGFDPRGQEHYDQTYRTEVSRQPQTQRSADGAAYAVSDSAADGDHCVTWTLQALTADGPVQTRYIYPCWDDLARANVPRGWVAWLRGLF